MISTPTKSPSSQVSPRSLFLPNVVFDGRINIIQEFHWNTSYENLSCRLCQENFRNLQRLHIHILFEHGTCLNCDYAPKDDEDLVEHMLEHVDEDRKALKRVYRCVVSSCLFFSPDKKEIREHFHRKHGDAGIICPSENCYFAFKDAKSQQIHDKVIHNSANSAAANQAECSSTSSPPQSTSEPAKSTNNGAAPNAPTSNSSSAVQADQNANQNSPKVPRQYQCRFCDQIFNAGGVYYRHIAEEHHRKLKAQCHACGKKFTTNIRRNDHARTCRMISAKTKDDRYEVVKKNWRQLAHYAVPPYNLELVTKQRELMLAEKDVFPIADDSSPLDTRRSSDVSESSASHSSARGSLPCTRSSQSGVGTCNSNVVPSAAVVDNFYKTVRQLQIVCSSWSA